MARRMAERQFHREQWERRYDDHVASLNGLVDELRGERGWLPYIAPMYGGRHAMLLSLLRDPGPQTRQGTGSGFLSMENDDPTAEATYQLYTNAGIQASDVVPWNAYPWYINRAPNAAEKEAGVVPLRRLMDLLPRLRVVLLHGGTAKDTWRRFVRTHPLYVPERGLHVIATYHTSRQALWHADPAIRSNRKLALRDASEGAARLLRRYANGAA